MYRELIKGMCAELEEALLGIDEARLSQLRAHPFFQFPVHGLSLRQTFSQPVVGLLKGPVRAV